ncbi:MAG: VIT family protein [Dermabacter sp.]|nr:VIT family protein [Dermabacter sp.]
MNVDLARSHAPQETASLPPATWTTNFDVRAEQQVDWDYLAGEGDEAPETAALADGAAAPGGADGSKDDRVATSARLNQLRAGVLGANDGIVSVAGMVVGVAAATPAFAPLAVAGVAAITAGALSMAMGEYVSVSTQRDTEKALLERTRGRLDADPDGELAALASALEETGMPADLARAAATRMSAHDALDAHARVRFGIEEDALVSPAGAAVASLMAFTLGGLLPLAAVLLAPVGLKAVATFAAVLLALSLTGAISARLGQAAAGRATLRTILGGSAAMAVTYGIGSLIGIGLG